MSLSEDVFATLSGGTPAARVFTDALPQQPTLPALVFTIIGGVDDFHLQGKSGLDIRVVLVDAWAGTRLSADALIATATELMVASQLFQVNAIAVAGAESYEPETERYRASRDYTLWIQE